MDSARAIPERSSTAIATFLYGFWQIPYGILPNTYSIEFSYSPHREAGEDTHDYATSLGVESLAKLYSPRRWHFVQMRDLEDLVYARDNFDVVFDPESLRASIKNDCDLAIWQIACPNINVVDKGWDYRRNHYIRNRIEKFKELGAV